MIKFFYLILFFLFTQSAIKSQEYWIKQASPTANDLKVCFFTDSLNGWIGGDSGLIIHTTDKGQTWNFQNSGVNHWIVSMFFLNERIGYALSWETDITPPNYYGTRILHTSNGGHNWSNYLFPDTNLFMHSIYFIDSLNGYMGGTAGYLFYTTNSGSDWIRATTDSGSFQGFSINKIQFYDSQNGYAVGGQIDIAGLIWKTTNGGRNWKNQIVGPEPVNDVHIIDSLNVFCAGGDFEYGSSKVITADGGITWDYQEFGVFGIANSIGYRTESEIWLSLGIVDSFLVSTNGGTNWSLTGVPNGGRIYSLIFVDERNGWAVGHDGFIFKYNSNLIGINNNSSSVPETIILHQNFPNPFNPNTIIRYDVSPNFKSQTSNVKLIVYNNLGKEITKLVNENKPAGNYEVVFDGSNLPSGVYFYQLKATDLSSGNESSAVRKMLLVK